MICAPSPMRTPSATTAEGCTTEANPNPRSWYLLNTFERGDFVLIEPTPFTSSTDSDFPRRNESLPRCRTPRIDFRFGKGSKKPSTVRSFASSAAITTLAWPPPPRTITGISRFSFKRLGKVRPSKNAVKVDLMGQFAPDNVMKFIRRDPSPRTFRAQILGSDYMSCWEGSKSD